MTHNRGPELVDSTAARASRESWTNEDETVFLNRPGHLHLSLLLASWTGQRQGDLLRLPWPPTTAHAPTEAIKDRRAHHYPGAAPLEGRSRRSQEAGAAILTTA